jgi:5'-3' exonuclease
MHKLHVLDGTYELFRNYFALPSLRAPGGSAYAGREVGAVRGLIGSMLSLLREPEVTHIAAATDHVIESFRNDLFAGYKTGAGIDPELFSQFPLAEEALRALGIVVWPMIEFEADDGLASAAAQFADVFDQIVILSPDKDLLQCVRDPGVIAVDRRRKLAYDAAAVRAKFGVSPAMIPDLLALVGDAADGLPGIPGWGLKSAAAVLCGCGSIEAIPDDAAAWPIRLRSADRLAANLASRRTDALLYKRLATLRTDVPLSATAADLEWHGVNRVEFQRLCAQLGFRNLAERPARWSDDS